MQLSVSITRLAIWLAILMSWGLQPLVSTGFALDSPLGKVLYDKESLYHRIIVEEHDDIRYLRFDAQATQSAVSVEDPSALVLRYSRYAYLPFLFQPDPQQILMIGLGGGTLPRKWHQDYPQVRIDAVEIDPQVIEVAKQFFFFREDGRLRAITQDGRQFVQRTSSRYDLVFVDAYRGSRIPFHLTTREFLQEVRGRLTQKGVVAFNLIGALTGSKSMLFRSLVKTLRGVFPQVYVFPVGAASFFSGQEFRNIILVATIEKRRWTRAEILQQAAKLDGTEVIGVPLSQLASTYYTRKIPLDDVPFLTDDYAPVETMQVR